MPWILLAAAAILLTGMVVKKLKHGGSSRTVEILAAELDTTPADIARQMEYLERIGMIRRVSFSAQKTCGGSCTGCDPAECKGCMPKNAAVNMGEIWEVVKR